VIGGRIYGVPAEALSKGSKERGTGKAACLGLGFGMGATKFQASAKALGGVTLEMPLCEKTVKMWREAHPEVVRFWYDLQTAYARATNGAKSVRVGFLEFSNVNGSVAVRLPSGRQLFYHEPKVTKDHSVIFTDPRRGRIETWGGLLAENVTQATARDIMTEALIRIDAAGYEIVLHIHDEIVSLVEEGTGKGRMDEYTTLMTMLPQWAKIFPIIAETKVSKRLKK
jgi:DNA polymerase